jgi:hypothetical protein
MKIRLTMPRFRLPIRSMNPTSSPEKQYAVLSPSDLIHIPSIQLLDHDTERYVRGQVITRIMSIDFAGRASHSNHTHPNRRMLKDIGCGRGHFLRHVWSRQNQLSCRHFVKGASYTPTRKEAGQRRRCASSLTKDQHPVFHKEG